MVRDLEPRCLQSESNLGKPITLLDVREPFERAIATIPITENVREIAIPMREIAAHLAELRSMMASSTGPLVVYCHHGVRSLMAAQWLAAQGLSNVYNLAGGIDAYSRDVDTTVPRYF